jgi:hypothetical protein
MYHDDLGPYTRDSRFDRPGLSAWRDKFNLLRWLPVGVDPNAD